MKQQFIKKLLFVSVLFFACINISYAQNISESTRKASENTTVEQIRKWVNNTKVTRIELLAKTYNFETPLVIPAGKEKMTIEGTGKNETILKLTRNKTKLIDAQSNNLRFFNLTLDGGNQSSEFGSTIFRFNKTKEHRFKNVHFKNSLQDAINSPRGWACEGLYAYKCEFSNIKKVCINIFDRNTNVRGELISKIENFTIDACDFNEGYERAVIVDCGNDRQMIKNKNNGFRYTVSTDLDRSTIRNSHFYKTTKFHIGGVQISNLNIRKNVFEGLMNGIESSGDLVHLEQLVHNIEIYCNTFRLENNLSRKFVYISIGGTEGHKRIGNSNASTNPNDWKFQIGGSNERRADTKCAKKGNKDGACKRDEHSYGSRKIYIANNTFEESNSIEKYIKMIEGEDNYIGWRRNSKLVEQNTFSGNTTSEKIFLGGNHLGTCGVRIAAGQMIKANNIKETEVSFGLAACRTTKGNRLGGNNLSGLTNNNIRTLEYQDSKADSLLSISPNPATNIIQLSTSADSYTVSILNLSGNIVKTLHGNQTNITVNVSSLTQGLYVMILTSDSGETKVEKLVIN